MVPFGVDCLVGFGSGLVRYPWVCPGEFGYGE